VASIKIMLKSSLINALLKAEKNTDFSNKIGEFLQKSGRRLNDLLQFLCSQNNGKELGRFQDDVPGLFLFRSISVFYFIYFQYRVLYCFIYSHLFIKKSSTITN
jgi:hypothetical protein